VKTGVAARFRVRSWNKTCQFNSQYKPGEISLVHARRNDGPITKHYALIGEVPELWAKKHKVCPLCPRMRTMFKYATEGFTTLEEMQENFHFLRNALLVEKDWTVNMKWCFQMGYFEFVERIAFEPWKGIDEREDLPMIPERPAKSHGMVVDQHSFNPEDHND
jgi:hypothetical protein